MAYTNIRCRTVTNDIRNRLNKKEKYEVGEISIARNWIKQPRVNVNLRDRITSIEQDELGAQITLQSIANYEDEFMLFEAALDNNFLEIFILCHMSLKSGGECQGRYSYTPTQLTNSKQGVGLDEYYAVC